MTMSTQSRRPAEVLSIRPSPPEQGGVHKPHGLRAVAVHGHDLRLEGGSSQGGHADVPPPSGLELPSPCLQGGGCLLALTVHAHRGVPLEELIGGPPEPERHGGQRADDVFPAHGYPPAVAACDADGLAYDPSLAHALAGDADALGDRLVRRQHPDAEGKRVGADVLRDGRVQRPELSDLLVVHDPISFCYQPNLHTGPVREPPVAPCRGSGRGDQPGDAAPASKAARRFRSCCCS